MNVIDYVILGFLLIGMLIGFRKGFINSIVTFIGTLIIIILAFYLKNPISEIFYSNLPFFNLGGIFKDIIAFNILIYEALSYILTLSLLSFILGLIAKVTGVFNKLVNATVVLGLPSKILGAICGLFEGYILAFIAIFILSSINFSSMLVNESKYADDLLTKTPGLSKVVNNTYQSITNIYQICLKNEDKADKTDANLESIDVLLKYNILDVKSADKLVKNGKLKIKGIDIIIDRYRGEKK